MNKICIMYVVTLVATASVIDVYPAQSAMSARAEKKYKKKLAIDLNFSEEVAVPDPGGKQLQQEEDTPLLRAIRTHDFLRVKRLVKKDLVNLGYQNRAGQTPLMVAAGEGNYFTIKFLLDAYPDAINFQDKNDDTALMYALRAGHVLEVQLLLKEKADPTLSNYEGKTPLMVAVARNNSDCTQVILDVLQALAKQGRITLKKELNRVDESGDTALQIALNVKAKQAQDVLLKVYGDVDLKAVELINAAKAGNEKEVDVLLATKVNVNYAYAGQTPLFAALQAQGPEATLKIVTKLIKAGARANVAVNGHTALQLMASKHFDRGWRARMKDSPAMSEVQGAIIDQLLAAGAEINGITNTTKATPLMLAIENYNGYIAQLLIDRGAQVKGVNNEGKTASELVHHVLKNKKIINSPDQSMLREWKRIQYHVDSDGDHLGKDFLKTPTGKFLTAVNNGNEKEVAEFIAQHPDCVNYWHDHKGGSALRLAVERNDTVMMELLLNAGANKNERYALGLSALMIALRENCVEAAAILIESGGIEINAVDNNGNTALMFLASSLLDNVYYCALVELLLERGEDATLRNKEGKTAADIVSENSGADERIQKRIVEMLKKAEAS